jgi:hypothetical protein
MRRTAAATAASLLAALALGGPLASGGAAAPTSVQCATATPSSACALLDDLAAQLDLIAPLVGDLAPLAVPAQGLAAESDQPGGVPTAEVVSASQGLLAQLATLPEPVESLVGAAGLSGLTATLQALVAELAAPIAGEQQSTSGSSSATPAARSTSSAPLAASGSRSGATGSSSGSTSAGSAPSGAAVPDVPVGDPLTLGPLALPDFGFDQSFEPRLSAVPTAELAQEASFNDAMEDLTGGDGHGAGLAVVTVLSLLLLAGAGVAQLQANRHQIPG